MPKMNRTAIFTRIGGAGMLGVMSEDKVRLQIDVPEPTRRRLKAESVQLGLDMGELATAILDYALPLVAAGKPPAALDRAIELAKKAKAEADAGNG